MRLRHGLRLLLLALSIALLVSPVAQATSGGSQVSASAAKKRLKVSCQQLYDEIGKTAEQFRAEYNAKGYTVNNYNITVGDKCIKHGKRVREGEGFMDAGCLGSAAMTPCPGEPNPNVVAYHWHWTQVVTVTKKGRLRSKASALDCEKSVFVPNGALGSTQIVPC